MRSKVSNSEGATRTAYCPECGFRLPADWPKGLCPRCALGDEAPQTSGENCAAVEAGAAEKVNQPARQFGDYELIEEIAHGGMGVVYRARQISLNRQVALKMILSGKFASKQEILRFRGEAESAANLRHPNIVAIYETGEHDGQHYFSMEFVRGRDLGGILHDGPLPPQRVAVYARIVAEAIKYAHQEGVLHRDLKPSNILIDENDQPRITDFGLAKRVRDDFGLTVTGQLLGSPNFMPPEQTSGKSTRMGPGADVYGIGAIIYTLLIGRPPFQGTSIHELLTQVRDSEPVAPRLLDPGIPRDLETICLKCLEKDPIRRYATAGELAEELNRFLQDEPIHARRASIPEKVWRWGRRKPLLASLILSLHLVGAVGLAGVLWQWSRAKSSATSERLERNRAELQAYASDMNLAQQSLSVNNLGRALELLDRHRGRPGQVDRRGWEWRYLWKQTQGDELFTLCQKPIPIFSLAISPDARLLAIGERNYGHLTLWDVDSRQEILRLPAGDRPDIFYIRAAFSPTEPLLAYGSTSGFPPTNMVSRVRLWNLSTRQQVAELPLEFLCSGIAFSQDGSSLITSTAFGTKMWDVHSGRVRVAYPVGSHQGIGTPFSITPDFRLMAQAFGSGQVRVFDLAAGKELWSTNASSAQVEAVALSTDGRLLATGGSSENSVIRLWNAADGRSVANFDPQAGSVIQLLFCPDQRTLISANTDQTIRVWDVSNPAALPPPQTLIGHSLEVWRLALKPDGKTLVSGGKDGSVRLWDLTRPPGHRGLVTVPGGPFVGWSFAGDGPALLTCDNKGWIARWTGQAWQTTTRLCETGRDARSVCFLPDRQEVVVAGGDGGVRVLRWTGSEQPKDLFVFPKDDFWGWCMKRHGNRLAVGRFDQQIIHDFEVTTWGLKESWRAPGTFTAMDFSPDGRYCVMGGYRGQVLVRDMLTGAESSAVETMPNIMSVGFSSLGDRVGLSCEQGFVRLLETGSWREGGLLAGFLHSAAGLSFSLDGQRLAVGSSGEEAIRVYELERHQPLVTFAAQGSGFLPGFDSSGNILAGMNAQGQLHVWSAPSWQEIQDKEKRAKR